MCKKVLSHVLKKAVKMLEKLRLKQLEYKYYKIMQGCKDKINNSICGEMTSNGIILCKKCNDKRLLNQKSRNNILKNETKCINY